MTFSNKTLEMLKGRYGNHDYSIYPDLTDYNIASLIKHKSPRTYAEFNKLAIELQIRANHIHEFQERTKTSRYEKKI